MSHFNNYRSFILRAFIFLKNLHTVPSFLDETLASTEVTSGKALPLSLFCSQPSIHTLMLLCTERGIRANESVIKQCQCCLLQNLRIEIARNIQFPFSKMASCGQPYNELGSAMVRALSLYLEGREFDSGRRDIAMKSKPMLLFDMKQPFNRYLIC